MWLQQFIANFFLFRFITLISFIFLLSQCRYQASPLFLDPQHSSPKRTPTITDRDYERNMTMTLWNDPDIHDNIIVSSNATYADSASSGRGFHEGQDLAIVPANVLNGARLRVLRTTQDYADLKVTYPNRYRAGGNCGPGASTSCPTNEECIDEKCACRWGFWRGTNVDTCEDINECTYMENNKCNLAARNSGLAVTCSNSAPSYDCVCPNGYQPNSEKTGCEAINNICTRGNSCNTQISTCVPLSGDYMCKCNEGYQRVVDVNVPLENKRCEDINECARSQTPCDKIFLEERQNGISKTSVRKGGCVNTPAPYSCSCSPGFEHQNQKTTTCHDINECSETPARCDARTSTCVNTRGDYYCDCLWGYKHDVLSDKICVDINECTEGVKGDKMNLACNPETSKCNNKTGTFDCVCYAGYKHTGKKLESSCSDCCQDIDECSMSKEEGKWLCEDLCKDGLAKPPQNYTCGCNHERVLYGRNCFDCQFGEWGPFGACNVTCGHGVYTRTRTAETDNLAQAIACSNPEHAVDTSPCFPAECVEEKCELSPWGQWTECDVKSGQGKQVRNRVILSKASLCGNVALKMEQTCSVKDSSQSWSQKTNWTQIAIAAGCLVAALVWV